MKSGLLFVLMIVLCMGHSCEKKLETCTYPIIYHSPSIAFVGFSETETKSISISTYKANTNFNELVDVDSLAQSSIEFLGDTAYAKVDSSSGTVYGFKFINVGFDYKIQCVKTGKIFLITNVLSGEKQHTWTSEHCSPGASQTRFFPLSFDVDGKPAYPGNYGYTLYLQN